MVYIMLKQACSFQIAQWLPGTLQIDGRPWRSLGYDIIGGDIDINTAIAGALWRVPIWTSLI